MKIAVFVSGNGTNLQALIDSISKGNLKARIALVVSDKEDAFALKRAKNAGIETFVLNRKKFDSRENFDKEISSALDKRHIEGIILAGFMRILSEYFVKKYKNKIINIHPSLLPLFKGTSAIKDAYNAGAKKTGVTVHFVDEKLDNGPIILQETVEIGKDDTVETLEEKIHKIEHKLYPKAIQLFVEGKLEIEGNKVKIREE
ncbi:MAG: phosphoribosylglycinamide formyltransferase, partial [Candidatus Omnitrophota bacterium]